MTPNITKMINEKNMFKFTVRKMGIQKDSNSIIPNDPSNIFEFNNKKRKLINFDDLFSLVKKKDNFEGNKENLEIKKNNLKTKKVNQQKIENVNSNKKIKRVDFSKKLNKKLVDKNKLNNKNNENINKIQKSEYNKNLIEKKVKENKVKIYKPENIKKVEVIQKTKKNENIIEVPKSNAEIESVSDILLLFCSNNLDKYSKKLYDILIKDKDKFNKDPSEVEIEDIENKIIDLNKEQVKWLNIKNNVLNENILEIPVKKENDKEIKEEQEEDNKLSKVIFLKNNMKSYLDNVTERLNEIEQKIFNMTAQDNEMDPLILLKALTRYN